MVFQTADAQPKIAVIGIYVDVDTGAPALQPRRNAADKIAPGVGSTHQSYANNTGPATEPAPSALLETLLSSVEEIAVPGTKVTSKPLIFSELIETLKLGSFQIYSGSMTAPPCTAGVSWNVATQKLKISVASFEKIRNVVKFNSRFPQSELGKPNLLSFAAANTTAM